RALTKKQWGQLALIGLTGGSIAFLLFFFALQNTSAITAGFLHKTIFIFATILAVVFLKEKINKKFLLGGILLFAGNFLVFSALESFSIIDLLVVAAVVLWAIENTFAKKVLKELSGLQVAFGRIFFGTLFMLPILFFSNNLPDLALLSWQELQWVLIASGFLFLFVASYYSGLKYIPVSRATALLLIGQPITAILSLAFLAKAIAPLQALGFLVLLGGIALVTLSLGSVKKPVLCVDRALQ
ncbi:DMT family transporter, partial [Candidatus Micrarchaeota archaeon]|nr:DMT family transporter [Candidatus Micrarchaeota archaeon]